MDNPTRHVRLNGYEQQALGFLRYQQATGSNGSGPPSAGQTVERLLRQWQAFDYPEPKPRTIRHRGGDTISLRIDSDVWDHCAFHWPGEMSDLIRRLIMEEAAGPTVLAEALAVARQNKHLPLGKLLDYIDAEALTRTPYRR